jgi:hypothetical protein
MFGDTRYDQIGELGGRFTNGQGAASGQETKDEPTRRVAQNPEQGITIA